jgi:Domain of unknown function (DUF4926)
MEFKLYQRVRLINDRHVDEGISKNALGYIIEIYEDNSLELEFSNEEGITIATIVVSENEIELAEP